MFAQNHFPTPSSSNTIVLEEDHEFYDTYTSHIPADQQRLVYDESGLVPQQQMQDVDEFLNLESPVEPSSKRQRTSATAWQYATQQVDQQQSKHQMNNYLMQQMQIQGFVQQQQQQQDQNELLRMLVQEQTRQSGEIAHLKQMVSSLCQQISVQQQLRNVHGKKNTKKQK